MDITCMDASWTGIFGNSTRPTATVSPTTRPIGQCDQARIDSTDHSNFKAVDTTKTHVLGVEFYKQSVDGMVCNRSVNEKKLAESGQASTNRGVQAWCKRQHPSAMVPGFDAAENG
jgi:hypothetical protein